MNLSDLRKKDLPFYAEYAGEGVNGRYRPGIVTPTWTAELDTPDPDDPLKLVGMFCELVTEWDLMVTPIPYGSDKSFTEGDVISYRDSAYRVLAFDEDWDGESPSPDALPERGKRGQYGPFQLENLGPAAQEYPVALLKAQLANVPGPLIGACLNAAMTAAQSGTDDAKKAGE